MPRREGQFLVEDFFLNTGGLNTSDSPFVVSPDACTGGKNFDYIKRGGIQKRLGHSKLNSTADTELRSLGLGLWDKPGSGREVIRAAGQRLQRFEQSAYTYTNLTEDTAAAGSAFFATGSTQPVVSQMYNSPTAGILWNAGGGASTIYGVYSPTKVTQNGVGLATGSLSTTVTTTGGSWDATGTYRYAIALHKASTNTIGNAALDTSAVVANLTDTVTISLASLGAIDTTKYNEIYLYRSSKDGALQFTAGNLAKIVNISAGVPASITDTGSIVEAAVAVPRAGSAAEDNSMLPTGTYKSVTLFKQRLVAAKESTVYFSETNKPESWPTYQTITIPSGGEITGLGIISRTFAGSDEIDEILCIFKQSELWIITGDGVLDASSLPNWSLKFIDNSGCAGQPLLVSAEGQLAWVNYRGVFMWDGGGKPKYLSQPIEDKFQRGGDIDKSKLGIGFGLFIQSRNEIQWYLSSKSAGEQKYVLKLDLRLSGGGSTNALGESALRGVFTPDIPTFPIYAGRSYLGAGDATEESVLLGDASGFLYSGFSGTAEAGGNLTFEYITPYLNFGTPTGTKRVSKIIAWVLDAGPYDLQLDFWTNYRFKAVDASTMSRPVSASLLAAGSKWGSFLWGTGVWGDNSDKVVPVVFNLASTKNNLEGDAIRLKFSHTGSSQTVTIYGFSVIYSDLPLRK